MQFENVAENNFIYVESAILISGRFIWYHIWLKITIFGSNLHVINSFQIMGSK